MFKAIMTIYVTDVTQTRLLEALCNIFNFAVLGFLWGFCIYLFFDKKKIAIATYGLKHGNYNNICD
jgi:phosphatidylglycerophosphatase A